MTRLIERRASLLILFILAVGVVFLAYSQAVFATTAAEKTEARKGLEDIEAEAHGAEEHAVEAEHGGEAAHGASARKWYDLLYRAMNFAVFLGVLIYLLRKPAKKFFRERSEGIKKQLDELEEQKREAEAQYEEVKGKLANLEAEVAKIIDEYLEEGRQEKEAIIAQAERQAEHIRQQAEFALEQRVKEAREALKAEIADACVQAAEELIKEKFTEEDQKRFIKEFSEKTAEA